jgi:hypothetical protein
MKLRTLGLLAVLSVTACGGSAAAIDASPTPPTPDAGAPSAILEPPHGAWLGHFYGQGTIAATAAKIGRTPRVHLTYFGWNEDWTTNDPTVPDDLAAGRLPLVNWEPDTGSGPVDFDRLGAGDFDTLIRARAAGSKALGAPFFLDFAAEMNGDEGWGGNDPARYIAGWRHIHDLFVAEGATNVVWVWAPNVVDVDGTNDRTMDYYPGDDYVDWTGVDGYNWGTSQPDFGWQSFHEVFAGIYPLLAAKGKPIFIGEMASDEVGGSKAEWIAGIVPTLRDDFPLVKAFVWFDIEKERHWPIDSSPAALAAYVTMAADPYLNP